MFVRSVDFNLSFRCGVSGSISFAQQIKGARVNELSACGLDVEFENHLQGLGRSISLIEVAVPTHFRRIVSESQSIFHIVRDNAFHIVGIRALLLWLHYHDGAGSVDKACLYIK